MPAPLPIGKDHFRRLREEGLEYIDKTRLIQDILGHASPTTTAMYAHLTEPSFQDRVKAINDLAERFRKIWV